jgi:hypothetical protein
MTNRDHSPFWESFTWKFAESRSDNSDSVVDFTNMYYANFKYLPIILQGK